MKRMLFCVYEDEELTAIFLDEDDCNFYISCVEEYGSTAYIYKDKQIVNDFPLN